VVGRYGIDRHPVDLADDDAVRWLEACLWPDVPGRVERFRSAVRLMAGAESPVRRGDMIDDLPGLIADAGRAVRDAHLVAFSSWALTYVDRSRRPEVAAILADAAADGRPVTWLTAEPPGCVPEVEPPAESTGDRGQTTVLAVRSWRRGSEEPSVVLGTAHPHGEWVDIAGPGG
jgi:hypothetical protein